MTFGTSANANEQTVLYAKACAFNAKSERLFINTASNWPGCYGTLTCPTVCFFLFRQFVQSLLCLESGYANAHR